MVARRFLFYLPCELESTLLKGGYVGGIISGSIIGVIKGDTRSLDYSTHDLQADSPLWGLVLPKSSYYLQGSLVQPTASPSSILPCICIMSGGYHNPRLSIG